MPAGKGWRPFGGSRLYLCQSGQGIQALRLADAPAKLDEGEVGRRARKGHSSRGTPLSLGWRAVSLPQAPAAKSRLTGYCLCSACNDVLEPSGS